MNQKLPTAQPPNRPYVFFGLFVAALVFLICTIPANHSEAEDAYHYARMVEQGALGELFHAHHLFYLPAMRLLFRGVQSLGYTGRSLPVLIAFSMVCGAGSLCLFQTLLRRRGVQGRFIWFFSLALLFSYGFWRYSTTAEIYMPAVAVSLAMLLCAQRGFRWAAAALGGAALLLHLVTLPVVLVAVPLLHILSNRRREAALHGLAVSIIAGAGYGIIYAWGIVPVSFSDELAQRASLLQPQAWLKGGAAFGQTLLAGGFVFAWASVAERLVGFFPYHMLQEEIFAGQQAAMWIRVAAPLTFGLAFSLLAGALLVSLRGLKKGDPLLAVPAVWLAGNAALALLFEPANPEMWLLCLPPFWILTAQLWRGVPKGRGIQVFPPLLAAALLAHNWVGGMSLQQSPEGDYCRQKGQWLLAEAKDEDLIVTAESHSFVSFMKYETPARILDAKFSSAAGFAQAVAETSGRVFICSDVLELLPSVAARAPEAVDQLRRLGEKLEPGVTPVHTNRLGMIYEWSCND